MIDITNLKFDLVDSTKPKFVEVVATYKYNHKSFHHYIFIEHKANYSKADYLKEAEVIFANDRARNKINVGKISKSNRFLITAVTIFGALTLAVGSFLAYQALKSIEFNPYNPGTSVKVKTEIPDLPEGYEVKLSNLEAKVNEKYETKITLSNPSTNGETHYRLPSVLDKVTTFKTDLTKEQYTYTYNSETEASLSIEGNYVLGPVVIKLTLIEVPGPGPTPVTGHKILLSDKSVGVSLPADQMINEDEVSSFNVKININEGYRKPIKIYYIDIGEKKYEYPADYSVINEAENYHITFNKPCTIDSDVTLTVSAQKIVTGTRKLDISSNFNLYKDIACETLYTPQELSAVQANKDFIGYIKAKTTPEEGTYLSLGVDISKGGSQNSSMFGEDYKYRFVAEDAVEITIPSGEENIDITPKLTQAKAEFIYHAKPGVEDILTLCFHDKDKAATIDWGDGSPLESFDTYEQEQETITLYHIYNNNQSIDKDYLISVFPNEESTCPVPTKIGFGDYNIDFDNEPTRFASGLKNIKGAHITNHFINILEPGFNHTSIDSFYISSNLNVFNHRCCNFMFCNNLEAFYVDPNNEIYSTDSDHTMLLRSDGADGMTVVSIANVEKVGFNAFITSLAPGACVGRNRLTSISFSKNFRSMPDNIYVPAISYCPNLNKISVSSANTTFMGDKGTTPVNALIKIDGTEDNGIRYTFYTTIANSPVKLLNECNELYIMPFAFSSANSYAGDILIDKPKIVKLAYFGFYNSPVTSITLEGNSFEINDMGATGSIFYKCPRLTSVVFDSFLKAKAIDKGLIQECPNLVKLDITTPIDNLVDGGVYAVNNTLYQYVEENAGMELIASSSVTNVLDEINIAGNPQPVVLFSDSVFNGNNLKEIYIPNSLLFGREGRFSVGITAPFKVNSDNPYYEVNNSIPGQSLLYGPAFDPESSNPIEGNALYACSLAKNNHTLTIPDEINILVDGMMYNNDSLYEIKFTAIDASQYTFINSPFVNCHNLTTVDFTASIGPKTPIISAEGDGTEVFIASPFQQNVTIEVGDPESYMAFNSDACPLHVYHLQLL